jgi:hypothetical protein
MSAAKAFPTPISEAGVEGFFHVSQQLAVFERVKMSYRFLQLFQT